MPAYSKSGKKMILEHNRQSTCESRPTSQKRRFRHQEIEHKLETLLGNYKRSS